MDLTDVSKSKVTERGNSFPNRNLTDGEEWADSKSGLSSFPLNKPSFKMGVVPSDQAMAARLTISKMEASDSWRQFLGDGDSSLFSSSLPAVFHKKSYLSAGLEKTGKTGETLGSLEEMESQTIGNLLPDDDELLAGIVDGFDNLTLSNNKDEPEDFDLFSSGGGLELDGVSRGLDSHSSVAGQYPASGSGFVIGEHPYGEHPSRTLFVRNINSNVEDSELRTLFEQYGDIRTLYTACKHRGFVMISYYDIRAARSAMRGLQNKPLRQRKLDIHFSIPKDNPSEKDINQGTLVVFNLDPSVSNDELREIFGAYGEVKEIRETPHKRHHKFIEFYDVRAADAALKALNRSDIAGKRIKLEPSRPGGARRSLMQMLSQELEQEENRGLQLQTGSPITNSPPGHPSLWSNGGSPLDNGFMRGLSQSTGLGAIIHGVNNKPFSGLVGTTPAYSTSPQVGTIGSHIGQGSQIENNGFSGQAGLEMKQAASHHPHSFPEHNSTVMPFYNKQATLIPSPSSASHVFLEGLEGNDVSLFEHAPGAIGIPNSQSISHISSSLGGSGSLTGPQFLWGGGGPNSSSYHQSMQNTSPGIWSSASPGQAILPTRHSQHQSLGYSSAMHGRIPNMMMPTYPHPPPRHHVGSAPPGDLSTLEKHLGLFGDSSDTPPFLGQGSYGPPGIMGSNAIGINISGGGHLVGSAIGINGGGALGMMSPRRSRGIHMFQTALPVSSASSEGSMDRGRLRRTENSASQSDNKKLYQLDLERIVQGEDIRTTLMIKNIPNKYTSKMLMAAIDEKHRGMYDFLYLPIDFKNKCNVGYAFINMTSPSHIIPFYEAFNGKKWEKFNSEKVASLAYARIQGKSALIAHFQNSSLMNEDKRCRPILFHSEGSEAGDQEPFPLGTSVRLKIGKEQGVNEDCVEISTIGSITMEDSASERMAVSHSPEKDQSS